VDDDVIVEVKSVSHLEPIHEAQLISYLKLSDRRVGLLINFNVRTLKNGVRRLVNGFPQPSALLTIIFFACCEGISSRDLHEFARTCIVGRKEDRQESPPGGGDLVAVGLLHFAEDAVGT